MDRTRELSRVVAVTLAGALTGALLIPLLTRPADAGASVRQVAAAAPICRSTSHPALVVLTQDNPSMPYGITTVEAIARVINRDLNPGAGARVPPSRPFPSWGTPDERIAA
jgi:hypothetical protein